MVKNFYEILSVGKNATQKEIASRFRELARTRHPDRFDGEEKLKAEKKFQDFTEAFNVLRDPTRRAQHDLDLARPAQDQTGQDTTQIAKVYISRGVKAYKIAKFMEAADNFERATQAEPDNAQAWHHLALTCFQEDRFTKKAQEAIQKAIELKPQHVPYVKLAAKIYVKAGVTKQAKEYYDMLLRLGGSDASVRQALEAKGTLRPRGTQTATTEQKDSGKPGIFRKIF